MTRSATPDWVLAAIDAISRDGSAVLVTQCIVEGSAPREAGAKMLLSADRQWGTIGGGALELIATEQARSLMVREDLFHLIQDYPLGPLLAQCCGGHVRLLLERLSRDDLPWLSALKGQTACGEDLWLETRLGTGGARKVVLTASDAPNILRQEGAGGFLGEDGCVLSARRPPREACKIWVEPLVGPPPMLVLFGAGHVGEAVAHVLSVTDLEVVWFDSRDEYRGRGQKFLVRSFVDPVAAVNTAPNGAMFLVMTHSHDLDYRLVRAILERDDISFCGVIGSLTKRARFVRRLRDDGLSEEQIARMTCGIGISGISGKAPAAIAISVAAQIMQHLGQRAGRSHGGAASAPRTMKAAQDA